MKIIRLVKPALFIYECYKIIIYTLILFFSSSEDIFRQLVYIAPSALFPLMALFIWMDSRRYKAYLPLFTAGKGIAVFTALVWSIVSGQGTMRQLSVNTGFLFIIGDLLAITAVVFINKDNVSVIKAETKAVAEESVCE